MNIETTTKNRHKSLGPEIFYY